MSTAIFRNYLDIINENSREPIQLNEGMLDTIKSMIPKVMKVLGGETLSAIAQKVKQITSGDFTLNKENALKVAQAFGFDKLAQGQQGQTADQIAEGWGLAGNWQGKLLQLVHLAGLAGGIAGMSTGKGGIGGWEGYAIAIGFILLMVSDTFWNTDRGSVGAMGRYGNKGFETTKGPTTPL